MDQELIAYLEERFRESSRQVQSFREETMSRFKRVDKALLENRDEIRRTQEDVHRIEEEVRHNQIVVEGMKSDLQGVAEGVLSTNQRLDAFREEMKQEIREVRKTVDPSVRDLSKRVRSLEEWRKRMSEDPVPRLRKKSGKKS